MASPPQADDNDSLLERLQRQLQEANLQLEQAQREAHQSQRQLQKTTLCEYLDANHDHVFTSFSIEQNRARTTQGNTDPSKKRVPHRLVPWNAVDFVQTQQETLALIHQHLPSNLNLNPDANPRRFENLNSLKGLGDRLRQVPVANEYHVESFQKQALEIPVLNVLAAFRKVNPAPFLKEEITFDRHLLLGEPDDALKPGRRDKSRADQHCTVHSGNLPPKVVLVVEYKVPHKLTKEHLRAGLHPMDIYQDVVNRPTSPRNDDEEGKFLYNAEQLVAAAVVQTYHYMLETGVAYGYLTTCEAIVFLTIDWKDLGTLYYHLAEPLEEVEDNKEDEKHRRNSTALSQILAFAFLALQAPPVGQSHRPPIKKLNLWKIDEASILAQVAQSPGKPCADSPAFKPRTYQRNVPRRQPNPPRRSAASCKPGSVKSEHDSHDDEDDDDDDPPDHTPTRSRAPTSLAPNWKDLSKVGDGAHSGRSGRQYCTQKCLLGLVRHGRLDQDCPNVSSHRCPASAEYHPVTHARWLKLVHSQLNADLDHDIEPLGIQGARGAMFKVSSSTYGYTFLAKGTINDFAENLKQEVSAYHRLQRLQGVCVPVFLGAVELKIPYYYTFGERIHHMILLSWAGRDLCCDNLSEQNLALDGLSYELVRSMRAVHAAGVLQSDVRAANALWNEEVGRVFVIDFERALIIKEPHLSLVAQEPPANAKKRRFVNVEDEDDTTTTMVDLTAIKSCRRQMKSEIWDAGHVFSELGRLVK